MLTNSLRRATRTESFILVFKIPTLRDNVAVWNDQPDTDALALSISIKQSAHASLTYHEEDGKNQEINALTELNIAQLMGSGPAAAIKKFVLDGRCTD
jgi:hypothetical protein